MNQITAKKRTGVFVAILVTCIVCSMLSTALNTVLPQIMRDFQVTTATGQWMSDIYFLVMGILVLVTPFLIRRCKIKPLYLTALTVFIAGLLLCVFTSSFSFMMVGRILQAAGNGMMVSLGQVIMLTIYPKEKRGSIMGIYGLAIGVALVLAPTLAGMIINTFGWRMFFYIVLIISTVAWFFTAVVFDNVLETGKESVDLLSLVLCSVGYSGIMIGVVNLVTYSLLTISVLIPLVAGVAAAVIFWIQTASFRNSIFGDSHSEK